MRNKQIDMSEFIVSTKARQYLYSTYLSIAVILGAIMAWFGEGGEPDWILRLNDVMLYLSIPVSGLATLHVSKRVIREEAALSNVDDTEEYLGK